MTPAQLKAFDIFWDKFNHKFGKAAAQRAWVKNWKQIKPNLTRVYRAAEMENFAKLPEGQTRKWAQGWLNEPRWIDERFGKPKLIGLKSERSDNEWRARLGPNQKSRWPFIHHHFREDVKHMSDVIREEYGFGQAIKFQTNEG